MRCSKCNKEKPIVQFINLKKTSSHWCKACYVAYQKNYRTNNREKLAKLRKDWREKNKSYVQKYYRKWYNEKGRKRNAASVKAGNIVAMAINDGRLVRPNLCELCEQEHNSIHAHHKDYNFPLVVIWVCPPCHANIHNGNIEIS